MSRIFSLSDLQLIPELRGMSEFDMIHPKNDSLINKYLAQLGFNTNMPILYVPNKHRNMQNKVVVGYRAVGEITQDREFLNSRFCSPIERVIAASRMDISLTRELSKLMGTSSIDFSNSALNSPLDDYETQGSSEYIESDAEEVASQISVLESIRDSVRGSPYNEYGNLKHTSEYY